MKPSSVLGGIEGMAALLGLAGHFRSWTRYLTRLTLAAAFLLFAFGGLVAAAAFAAFGFYHWLSRIYGPAEGAGLTGLALLLPVLISAGIGFYFYVTRLPPQQASAPSPLGSAIAEVETWIRSHPDQATLAALIAGMFLTGRREGK
jgi:hypothetical protein